MGNCVFRGLAEADHVIKVVTSTGGIMELYPPITAECITNEFPGQAIFHSRHLLASHSPRPLLHSEELLVGELYYLLPRRGDRLETLSAAAAAAPYRMSFDSQGPWRRAAAAAAAEEEEVVQRCNVGPGVWKVKLVISPEQLTEILSQEAKTEALIESVRTVAKCGNGFASAASSDQWSMASSWKEPENVA